MGPARKGCFPEEGGVASYSCYDKAAPGVFIHFISGTG